MNLYGTYSLNTVDVIHTMSKLYIKLGHCHKDTTNMIFAIKLIVWDTLQY